jgi:hypothetical protein
LKPCPLGRRFMVNSAASSAIKRSKSTVEWA